MPRHGVNNKAARREVEAVKGCRRQPEAMGEWIGRREDTTAALGQSRGRISSEEESVTSRLVFLLERRLGGVAARWRLRLKAMGAPHISETCDEVVLVVGDHARTTPQDRLIRAGMRGALGFGAADAPHIDFHRVKVGEKSGLGVEVSQKRVGEENSREDTCLAQASPRPSAGSSFKLREEAVGRWQCSSRYGKGVEAEFIEWIDGHPRFPIWKWWLMA
ncbi:hypothetical protein B0H14DRAFT_3152849 [Mycena olivaceomarginata]|nr:hypothetical protein B0H14DRAFT_3152849 [Mycena olivaceomarginata]